ncbi:hypothetical protein Trichorick_00454 [Candidatus Trichorickettsia mobilis]|uniref:Uncharacterized protein n=1 Tax=Candidatus Trichorickettsia mobilis TaxID=1346319 RepID=A0ABZ0URA4_9RICK|nr:hypothetical protein [Candidatus Trichorickettsia mobilis]WPY00573.1 hypothetical protein Trichorick_00454 [Candidatus Trichorickettsia mobilis]
MKSIDEYTPNTYKANAPILPHASTVEENDLNTTHKSVHKIQDVVSTSDTEGAPSPLYKPSRDQTIAREMEKKSSLDINYNEQRSNESLNSDSVLIEEDIFCILPSEIKNEITQNPEKFLSTIEKFGVVYTKFTEVERNLSSLSMELANVTPRKALAAKLNELWRVSNTLHSHTLSLYNNLNKDIVPINYKRFSLGDKGEILLIYSEQTNRIEASYITPYETEPIIIKQENLPPELQQIDSLKTFHAFLRNAYVNISELDNGDFKLYVNQRCLGGQDNNALNNAVAAVEATGDLLINISKNLSLLRDFLIRENHQLNVGSVDNVIRGVTGIGVGGGTSAVIGKVLIKAGLSAVKSNVVGIVAGAIAGGLLAFFSQRPHYDLAIGIVRIGQKVADILADLVIMRQHIDELQHDNAPCQML